MSSLRGSNPAREGAIVVGMCLSALVTTGVCGERHEADSTSDGRVRDKLYIWTHPAGSHDGYYLAPHTHVESRMTPVEGARYLGVPNLYFIQYGDAPPLSEYRKYAISFRPMREVIWSLTALAGRTSEPMRRRVLELAAEFPNIEQHLRPRTRGGRVDTALDR